MNDASTISQQIQDFEDDALQKRFRALFDDGQGDNARLAFVQYCRARGYHPSEMAVLAGANIFKRQNDMLDRQDKILDEYRAANKWLLEAAKRLNGGKAVLPPSPENLRRGALFQRIIRQKFGNARGAKAAACRALGLKSHEFRRLEHGIDVTDTLLDWLDDLPDSLRPKQQQTKSDKRVANARYEEFERRFSHIKKPVQRDKNRSTMTTVELAAIGKKWFGQDDWLTPMARFLGYSRQHLDLLIKNQGDRYISQEVADYIRLVERELTATGGFTETGGFAGPPLAAPRNGKKTRLP